MYVQNQRQLGDFNITLPAGLIQTTMPVSTEAAAAASTALIKEIFSSPVVWILTGTVAYMVLSPRRSRR
jgi:hypothetical protein